jgi:hypothetical protein
MAMCRFEPELILDVLDKRSSAHRDRCRPLPLTIRQAVLYPSLDPLKVCSLKVLQLRESTQLAQASQVDDCVTLRRLLDLSETALLPLVRMTHYPGTNHVQVDVN